jgi:hypothetical protein
MTKARPAALALIVVCALTVLTFGAVTFDGLIGFAPGEEWAGVASTAQDNYTQFGNQILSGFSGSELDELYVRTDGYFLYVAATGNLQENGNAQILLLEVRPGGQNVLKTEIAPVVANLPCSGNGPPYAVQGLGQALTNDGGTPPQTIRDSTSTGTVLDAGFAPNYAIAVDTFGHTVHVTQYDLSDVSLGTWDDPGTNDGNPCGPPNEALAFFTTRVYRGEVGVDSGSGLLGGAGTNPNGWEVAYNNTGFAGVTGSVVSAPGSGTTGDPRTQITGLEAKISLLDLGFTQDDIARFTDPVNPEPLAIKVAILLTSGGGLVSNQTLPGIAGANPPANIGSRPDFAGITTGGIGGDGKQFATLSLMAAAFAPTIDGADLVNKYGVASVVASQDTPTSFGDRPQNPDLNSGGSELDQMFLRSEGDLQLGITGNLEPNGNDLVIFLDTLPDVGEGLTTVLDANAGRISGMVGDAIPLNADYAVVINDWQGTIYVDLIDLNANTTTYMGSNAVGSGNGNLSGGAAGPDWQIALNDTNVVGVDDNPANDPVVQASNALTATTGFEIKIPLSAVGDPAVGSTTCVFALVKGGNSGYLSNQFLPAGVGGGWPNFGNPPVDLTMFGYQCMGVTITAGCAAPVVTSITPNSAWQGYDNFGGVGPVHALIAGSNFADGATVKLALSGKPDIVGTNVVVVDANTITADFDLTGAAPGALVGTWDVVVTTCATGTLPGGFEIKPPCNTPPEDADGDRDVDLSDFGVFQSCFNGPNRPFNVAVPSDARKCKCFDTEPAGGDGDVDLADFGKFQACFNGPNRPPASGCGT